MAENKEQKAFFLNQELVDQVLSWLPVRLINQFKIVSKTWLASIETSKLLVESHLQHSSNQRIFAICFRSLFLLDIKENRDTELIITGKSKIKFLDLDPVDTRCGYRQILVSYNGLVCVINFFNRFFLLNPSTREAKLVQEGPNDDLLPPPSMTLNLMNPKYSKYGFAFDPSTGDYKILKIVSQFKRFRILMFSLLKNLWSKVQEGDGHFDFKESLATEACVGAFSHDSMHWFMNRNGKRMIVSIGIANNDFQEVAAVPMPIQQSWSYKLGVVDDFLCMIQVSDDRKCDCWLMRDCGNENSWQKYSFEPKIQNPGPWRLIWNLGNLMWCDREIFLINGKGSENVSIKGSKTVSEEQIVHAVICKESLVSPKVKPADFN